ncbi:uncharacterized protein susd5 isoform X2 [Oryzias latipes]|uniref:Sushi domain containing 5 n=1 Tax=Oryzias latipes TaxID=8090 RepID=A0A3B3I6S3_ORYLA
MKSVKNQKETSGVFVLDLRNSSGFKGFSVAEKACASKSARLASLDELLHAVVQCFFSECTRGWLHGGTVGTTVCNVAGGSLRAVDVRTENATEDAAHLDAFCIQDKATPCGDPPSFPYARLQEHSGFETGDELLYTCAPGYAMPGGDTSFSLLCDSCGEWYGTVQICVKDQTESHVDYEDKYSDSYGDADHSLESQEEVHGETHQHGGRILERQESTLPVKVQQKQHREPDIRGKVTFHSRQPEGVVEEGAKQEASDHHLIGHPRQEQEKSEVVRTETAAATEEPVSVLSQKHMFWFPSEAFQEEGYPVSTDSSTQTTQRTSGALSEESKEHNSQEVPDHQQSINVDHHHDDGEDDNNRDKGDTDDHDHYDDPDSHQEEDQDDHTKHPALHEDLERPDHPTTSREDHDDHYDMGEHEEEPDRVLYGSREYDDGDDTPDDHHSIEDHDVEHPDVSKEHPDDRDDVDDHHDDHDDDEIHDDRDSHESDGGRPHDIISVAAEKHQNVTQRGTGGKATKADTWLDSYPVAREKTKNGESKTGTNVVKMADRPNEVEVRKPVPSSQIEHDSTGRGHELDQGGVGKVQLGAAGTPAAFPDLLEPSDSPSYSDTLDYDTQQAAPTRSWLDDLTEQPFQDHGPAPPVHNGEAFTGVMGGQTVHNLPGEAGERGELEGDMRGTMCTGENCPPPPPVPSGRGPKVAAIIVAVCAVATAVMVGVWCYRRQQQKSSAYEMNGKGQSQITQSQQIEMQQKV